MKKELDPKIEKAIQEAIENLDLIIQNVSKEYGNRGLPRRVMELTYGIDLPLKMGIDNYINSFIGYINPEALKREKKKIKTYIDLYSKAFGIKKEQVITAKKNGHTKIISFWVHPELETVMKEAAKARNVPVSRLYRAALECYTETIL
jgi:hypothetical protein